MEALLRAQKSALEKLDLMIEKFKKDKSNPLTLKIQYRKQAKELEAWWKTFQKQHSELLGTEHNDGEYFSDEHYAKILSKFSDHLEEVNHELKTDEPNGDYSEIGESSAQAANKSAVEKINQTLNAFDIIEKNNDSDVSIENMENLTVQVKAKVKFLNLQQNDLKSLLSTIKAMNCTATSGMASAQLEMLKTSWNDYRGTAMEIRLLDTGIDLSKQLSFFQNEYLAAHGKLNDFVSNSRNQAKNIELPKLKIPEFDGKIGEWKTYIDLFDKIIHSNQSITPALKMQYLKTS